MTHERVAKHAASQSGAAQLVPVARTNADRFPDVFRVSSLKRSRLFPTRSTSDLECVLAKTKEKEIRHETTESTEMVWRGGAVGMCIPEPARHVLGRREAER